MHHWTSFLLIIYSIVSVNDKNCQTYSSVMNSPGSDKYPEIHQWSSFSMIENARPLIGVRKIFLQQIIYFVRLSYYILHVAKYFLVSRRQQSRRCRTTHFALVFIFNMLILTIQYHLFKDQSYQPYLPTAWHLLVIPYFRTTEVSHSLTQLTRKQNYLDIS